MVFLSLLLWYIMTFRCMSLDLNLSRLLPWHSSCFLHLPCMRLLPRCTNIWKFSILLCYIYIYIYIYIRVGIATGYRLDSRKVGVWRGGKIFLHSMSSRLALGPTQPPIEWVLRTLSPGVKRLGREADHSPPTSAEVKNMWICTSTPPWAFMV
jgi:hypothetical protein